MEKRNQEQGGRFPTRTIRLALASIVISALIVGLFTGIGALVYPVTRQVLEVFHSFSPQAGKLAISAAVTVLVAVICTVGLLGAGGIWRCSTIRFEWAGSREVTAEPSRRASLVNPPVFIRWLRGIMRIVWGSTLVWIYLMLVITGPFLPPLISFASVLLAVWATLQEFYATGAHTQEALQHVLDQLLLTLGGQVEEMVAASLGHRDSRVGCQILVHHPESRGLIPTHTYHMTGRSDRDMRVDADQGIRGRVLSTGRPHLANPYVPQSDGFSKEEVAGLPRIIWLAAWPLLGLDDEPFGVLTVDCDHKVGQDWLGKLVAYGSAMSHGISIVHALLWRSVGPFPLEADAGVIRMEGQ